MRCAWLNVTRIERELGSQAGQGGGLVVRTKGGVREDTERIR